MNPDTIYIGALAFAGIIGIIIGQLFDLHKYNIQLLASLEKIVNDEGNKIIPTKQLNADLKHKSIIYKLQWLLPIGMIILFVYKTFTGQ